MTITDLTTSLDLAEETATEIHNWVSDRESTLASEKSAAITAERNLIISQQSAAQNDAQETWDNLRDSLTQSLDTATQQRDQLQSLYDEMVGKVSAALQSGDPEQYQALGIEFLTPENEKKRAELLAQKQKIEDELAALEP